MRDLPVEMKIGLRDYGIQEARLSKFSLRTRVIRDLRIFGDGFVPFYETLARAYESDNPPPLDLVPSDLGNDKLFVVLGSFIPFFDRYIEAPDLTLGALDNYLRS